MLLIAHRGNLEGPNRERENQPDYIDEAIKAGYNVMIDVWMNIEDGSIHLGEDTPLYQINPSFLLKRKGLLWCRARNLEALSFLLSIEMHVFFHNKDDYALTNQGIVWAAPGRKLDQNTVCVLPERSTEVYSNFHLSRCHAICTDYVKLFRAIL